MKLNNNNTNFQANVNNAFESAKASQIPGGTYVCSLISVKLIENERWNGFIVNLRIHGGKFDNRRIGALLSIQPDVQVGDDGKYVFQDGKAVVKVDKKGKPVYDSLVKKLNVLVGLTCDNVDKAPGSTEEFARILNSCNPEKVFKATLWASQPKNGKVDMVYNLNYIKPIMANSSEDESPEMGGHVELPL